MSSLAFAAAVYKDELPSIASLRALEAPSSSAARCSISGYYEAGDGGGGDFYWDAASALADDAGLTIKPTSVGGAGRWRRLKQNRDVDVRWFGAIADGTTHPLSEFFGSLGAAQVYYPHAVALSDEIDWAAIQATVNAIKGTWTSPTVRSGNVFLSAGPNNVDGLYVVNREINCEWTIGMKITGLSFGAASGLKEAAGSEIIWTGGGQWLNPSNTQPCINARTSYYFTLQNVNIAYSNPAWWGHLIEFGHRGGNTVGRIALLSAITFSGGNTITRASGSFGPDGDNWRVGDLVHVQGSVSNDAKTGTVVSVAANGLSMVTSGSSWTNEVISFTGNRGLYTQTGDTQMATVRDCAFVSTYAEAGTGAKAIIAMTSAIICAIENCAFLSAEIGILFRDFGYGSGVYSNAHVVRNCQFGYLDTALASCDQDIVIDGCTFEGLGGYMTAYVDIHARTTASVLRTFTFNPGPKTIVCSSGRWDTDGWTVGMAVDYGSDDGFYGPMGTITAISGDGLTMTVNGTVPDLSGPAYSAIYFYLYNDTVLNGAGIQSDETPGNSITVAGTTMTRSDGESFIDDGWTIGESVNGPGGGGYGAITNISASTLTFADVLPAPQTYTQNFYIRGGGGGGPLTFMGCWFGDQYRTDSWLKLLGSGALSLVGNFFDGNARILTNRDRLLKGSITGNVLGGSRRQESILCLGTSGAYGLSIRGNAGGCHVRSKTSISASNIDMGGNTPLVDGEAFQRTDDTFVQRVMRMSSGLLITTTIYNPYGTDTPASLVEIRGGDYEASTVGKGYVLKSPNGTRYRIKVANDGTLSTETV